MTPEEYAEQKALIRSRYMQGKTVQQVAEEFDRSDRVIRGYVQKGDWRELRDKAWEDNRSLNLSSSTLGLENFESAMRVINRLSIKIEKAIDENKWEKIPVTLKSWVEAVDKLNRLKLHMDSGGVTHKEISIKKQVIEWAPILELCSLMLDKHGTDFDQLKFTEAIVTAIRDK